MKMSDNKWFKTWIEKEVFTRQMYRQSIDHHPHQSLENISYTKHTYIQRR